jgi:hypothetical protein
VNDSTPLPHAAYEIAQWPLGHQAEAADRWRSDLGSVHPATPDLEFADDSLDVANADDCPGDASPVPATLSKRVLQVAVIANGGALVALAFTITSVVNGSGAGVTAAVVLGFGLLSAAVSLLAYLNFEFGGAFWPRWMARLVRTKEAGRGGRTTASFWFAAVSGAGSYAALCVAALWLLPVVIGH